jgi:hypothetical protein
MTPLESTIDIDVDPEHAFAYMTDPPRFLQWQRDLVAVQKAEGTGARGPVHHDPLDRTQPAHDNPGDHRGRRPRRWSARGVDGPVRPNATVVVQPRDGGHGSRVTVILDFGAAGLAAALLPLVRRQASKLGPLSYRTLKEVLESETGRGQEQ